MSGIPASVRPHHWGFANAWLRSSFQRIPETIVSAIARSADSPDTSDGPVVDAWQNFAKTLDEQERLPPKGLETAAYSAPSENGDWYVAVVEFPEPAHPQEAYFAALCVRPPDGRLRPAEREQVEERQPRPAGFDEEEGLDEPEESRPEPSAEHRYFLLERTDSENPQIVEWVGGERDIVGEAAADEQAFVKAVSDLLTTGNNRQ